MKNFNRRKKRRNLIFMITVTISVALLILVSWQAVADKESTGSTENLNVSSDSENDSDSTEDDTQLDDYGFSVANQADHEDLNDYEWDSSSVVEIELNGNSVSADDEDVSVDDDVITIKSAGAYELSGSLDDGQILIDADDEDIVQIILSGVDINNSQSSPVYVKNAKKVIVISKEGTTNVLTDSDSYSSDGEDDEPNATIFSKSDLSIYGSGTLNIESNYNDAISSKDGLVLRDVNLEIESEDDGIRGKDYVVVKSGDIEITANGDGIKSDNEDDVSRGYVSIEDGDINIESEGDSIAAKTDILVTKGNFDLTSGGGSPVKLSSDVSGKGLKAEVSVVIDGGEFLIDAADDAIHSNYIININNSSYEIASGDDGIHADSELVVNGGDILINKSYEGLESAVIVIEDGDIDVTSSDDGLNIAGGNDSSGTNAVDPRAQTRGSGGPGQDTFSSSDDNYLHINGGYILVDANGDGVDVNGSVKMTDGTLLVDGPISNGNGALDYDGEFEITGGLLIASGSSGMAMAPSTSSSQNSVLVNFSTNQSAGQVFSIKDESGEEIASFTPTKNYQSVVVSSPELLDGDYKVYVDGSEYSDISITSSVTTVGQTTGGMGGGRMR